MRSAGTVNDPDHKLWGPVKWVAQMVQYLIALVMISTFVRWDSAIGGDDADIFLFFFSLYSNCRRFQIDSERGETEGSETEAVEDGVMMVMMMIMMSRMRGRGEEKETFRSLFLLDDDDVRDGPRPDEYRVLV